MDLVNTEVVREEAQKAMEAKFKAFVAKYPERNAEEAARNIALLMQLHNVMFSMMGELMIRGEPKWFATLPMLQTAMGILVRSVCNMAGFDNEDTAKFAKEVTTIVEETTRSVETSLETAQALSEKMSSTLQ